MQTRRRLAVQDVAGVVVHRDCREASWHNDCRRSAVGQPATLAVSGWVRLWMISRYCRMLTARAMTSATVARETADCTIMVSLAQADSGITSVGLKAVALVKDR